MSTTVKMLFNDNTVNRKNQMYLAFGFFLFTLLIVSIDSVFFLENYFDGRTVVNFLVISYFSLFFYFSDSHLRRLMFVMVFLSYSGELIFCTWLEMYHYRTNVIPLYVPFGHAIVYVSGYVFAHTNWAIQNEIAVRKFSTIAFLLLFLLVGIFLNDIFSILLGALFFVVLKRKKWQNLYYWIAFCVIYIELLGTYFKCWTWNPLVFDAIPTINPPVGAVFIYAGGDVLLAKIVQIWERNNYKKVTIVK